MRTQLQKRGMEIDVVFPMCGEENETVLHRLAQCGEVRRMWYISPLRLQVSDTAGMSFKHWCNALGKMYKDNLWWISFGVCVGEFGCGVMLGSLTKNARQ